MQIANNRVFNNTASSYGPWIDMARFDRWSLQIFALESGGSIVLWGSNEQFAPADDAADTNAVTIGSPITTNTIVEGDSLPFVHWMQIQKIAGGSATQTIANIMARLV